MSYRRTLLRFSLLLQIVFTLLACGVKGDPLPPEKPIDIGRGRPTYKRATEGLRVKEKRSPPVREEEEKDERE